MYEFDFFLPCAKGVQPLLSDELKQFPVQIERESSSGIMIKASLKTAYTLCLWSRLTNRVLMHLGTIDASNSKHLYESAHEIAWDSHFGLDETFLIHSHGTNRELKNSHYSALRLKDSIVDFYQKKLGTRPNIDKNHPDIQIHLFIRGLKGDLYLDLSGDSLHRRGYRQMKVEAPLKETLAACLLASCKWHELARDGADFIDPMCGSGTLAIEALMVATDMAPGLLRKAFGFNAWKQFEPTLWQEILKEAYDRFESGRASFKGHVQAFDQSADMVKGVAKCLEDMGLAECMSVEQKPLNMFDWSDAPTGLLLTNPPYGHRIGDSKTLAKIYKSLDEIITTKPSGWHAGIFTAETSYESSQSVKPTKKYYFYNGRLQSQLYYY